MRTDDCWVKASEIEDYYVAVQARFWLIDVSPFVAMASSFSYFIDAWPVRD